MAEEKWDDEKNAIVQVRVANLKDIPAPNDVDPEVASDYEEGLHYIERQQLDPTLLEKIQEKVAENPRMLWNVMDALGLADDYDPAFDYASQQMRGLRPQSVPRISLTTRVADQ